LKLWASLAIFEPLGEAADPHDVGPDDVEGAASHEVGDLVARVHGLAPPDPDVPQPSPANTGSSSQNGSPTPSRSGTPCERRPPRVDGPEVRSALVIVDALYRSAEAGRWVAVTA
jgi:hypothetical protein